MKQGMTACVYILCLFLASACTAQPDVQHELPSFGANLSDGYSLVYEANFTDKNKLTDFEMTDPKMWTGKEVEGVPCLELLGTGDYEPEVRSPLSIALLTKMKVGNFVMEVDAESTDLGGGGHRDVCFFFGFDHPSRYYYVHVAAKADPHAHNIFLVNNAPRVNIATRTTDGVRWGSGIRHRIRIERTLTDGAIRVFFDDMNTPIMEAVDKTFGFGYVGIGSFDNSCKFYAFKVYSPEARMETKKFFGGPFPADTANSDLSPAEAEKK